VPDEVRPMRDGQIAPYAWVCGLSSRQWQRAMESRSDEPVDPGIVPLRPLDDDVDDAVEFREVNDKARVFDEAIVRGRFVSL
jgi:hypothetical protein